MKPQESEGDDRTTCKHMFLVFTIICSFLVVGVEVSIKVIILSSSQSFLVVLWNVQQRADTEQHNNSLLLFLSPVLMFSWNTSRMHLSLSKRRPWHRYRIACQVRGCYDFLKKKNHHSFIHFQVSLMSTFLKKLWED